jgi:serine/threonine-protein kinase
MDAADDDDPRVMELLAAIADGQPFDPDDVSVRSLPPEIVQSLLVLAEISGARIPNQHADSTTSEPAREPTPAPTHPSVWRHLSLREQVGAGHFGTVYRAWDTVLERDVALKLLHSVAAGMEDRVVAEARLLARVTNHNVVTVFGADRADEQVGVWMEFIEGHTLEAFERRNGPCSAQEALLYGLEICRALAAVHRAGLVHGDIKAQNVMRARGGRIVLTDFGAARLARAGVTSPVQATPLYMAPEVLLGAQPTERSDIYSLGVLLFFLVTGEFPILATSLGDLKHAHAGNRKRFLRDIRPDLPSSFVLVVDTAMAPRPEDRPGSAGALEALIERAAGTGPTMRPALASAPGRSHEDGASVVVLTFTDLSPDKRLGYFCGGLAEEIFDALTRTPGIRAVASGTILPMEGNGDARQAAEALGVSSVLVGSVRAAGDRLRVIARLIHVQTGASLWSAKFERRLDDVFGVQDEITEATVRELNLRIGQPRTIKPAASTPERDSDAYTLYLKGRHCWNQRTEVAMRKSVEHFRAAIDRDPGYAEAHAGLAEAYATLGLYGVAAPDDVMAKAKAAARQAIDLAPHLPAPHATSGCVAAVYDWSWHEAARHFHRALDVNEQHPVAHHWYAINYLVPLRRFDEAAFELRRAADADPFSAPIRASFGIRSYFAHKFAEAERELRETLHAEAGSAPARLFLGLTLVESQAYTDAIRELETAMHLAASPEMRAALAYALARAGHTDAARTHLGALTAASQHRYVSPSLVAQVHAGLGETDQAVAWLEKAIAVRAADLAWIAVRPVFDGLRSHTAFNGLVTRVQP